MSAPRALDLRRRAAHAISLLQYVVARRWLAINPNQVITGLAVRNPLLEKFGDRCSVLDVDMIGVAAAIIIDP